MKVMILANDTTYIYNTRDQIIKRLVCGGHEVVVVATPLLHYEDLENLGCRIVDMSIKRRAVNPFSDFSLLMSFCKLLHQEKPDVALTYNIKPNVYGGIACQMMKIPYIPTITGLGTAVGYPGFMQKISKKLYKLGIAKASCVMFQNEENKQFFLEHNIIPKSARTRLLPGSGVNLEVHKATDYPPPPPNSNNEVINFLFATRLIAQKGIDLYLNAARRIFKKHKNVMFHICGYCDDKKYIGLLKEAEKSLYIRYHGVQKNMIPFFEMCHCVVHPSYYPEGISTVLLEAMAHCRPIITTNQAGCREAVDDGKNGFLIPVKDEDALVGKIEQFLRLSYEEKRDMGLYGRIMCERLFDRQICVNAYLDEIEKTIN